MEVLKSKYVSRKTGKKCTFIFYFQFHPGKSEEEL